MPSVNISSHDNATLLAQFEHYIEALLIDHPNKPQVFDTSKPLTADSILWVTDSDQQTFFKTDLTEKADLNEQQNNRISNCIDLDALTQSDLKQKYALTCFWLPNLSHTQFKTYLPALIRCRDMYSHYTIAVLASHINLRPYGFCHLSGSPIGTLSHQCSPNPSSDDSLASTADLQAWQFNLYDYKPRPKWFNADYWANPENWDKFRW